MDGQPDSWEQYKDKRNEYRWRRRNHRGVIIGAACEGYLTPEDCDASAERHGMNANPRSIGLDDHWEFFCDRGQGHRWRRRDHKGDIIGASSQSYKTEEACKANASLNGMIDKFIRALSA